VAKRHSTDERPTIAQIAQIAGVSMATVSKVVNGRADVARPTRERVEHIIEEHGFVSSRAARAIPKANGKAKAGQVDLILPRLDAVQAGATLLFESDPAAEERETQLKARALLETLAEAAAGPGRSVTGPRRTLACGRLACAWC